MYGKYFLIITLSKSEVLARHSISGDYMGPGYFPSTVSINDKLDSVLLSNISDGYRTCQSQRTCPGSPHFSAVTSPTFLTSDKSLLSLSVPAVKLIPCCEHHLRICLCSWTVTSRSFCNKHRLCYNCHNSNWLWPGCRAANLRCRLHHFVGHISHSSQLVCAITVTCQLGYQVLRWLHTQRPRCLHGQETVLPRGFNPSHCQQLYVAAAML